MQFTYTKGKVNLYYKYSKTCVKRPLSKGFTVCADSPEPTLLAARSMYLDEDSDQNLDR